MFPMKKALNVVINGSAGNIAYSLLPLLCNGLVFGPDVQINLKLLEIPAAANRLQGTIMELNDGSYQNLQSVQMHLNAKEAIKDSDVCIFIASTPHKKGMERSDLLKQNLKIYKTLAQDINRYASSDCKVVVVANPVNSLTTIMAKYAPRIPYQNFTCLSRLDHNRGKGFIAKKCGAKATDVNNLIIWGNHSDTQYADTSSVTVKGVRVQRLIDSKWLKKDFVNLVAGRWKQIVEKRGCTSIMSPANAVKDHLHDWFLGTPKNSCVSMGVISDGSFGVPKGMCFSMPVKTKNFNYEILGDLKLDEFTKDKIQKSIKEIDYELNSVGFKL
jgi:malate dehydrogenase